MDAFIATLYAHRENVHANFHCGVLCDLDILLYNLKCSLTVPCKSADFPCNQDVRACTMGCEKGLNLLMKYIVPFQHNHIITALLGVKCILIITSSL